MCQILCEELKLNGVTMKHKKMVLSRVFTFVFIFITEVNIVCKIKETFTFFYV